MRVEKISPREMSQDRIPGNHPGLKSVMYLIKSRILQNSRDSVVNRLVVWHFSAHLGEDSGLFLVLGSQVNGDRVEFTSQNRVSRRLYFDQVLVRSGP